MNNKNFINKYAAGITLLIFLGLWELGVRIFSVPVFILPPPSKIILALWVHKKILLLKHLPVTFIEVVLGLVISVIISALLAVAMLINTLLERSIYPLLVASQTIPIIVLSPVFIMWFGYGLPGKVAITVLITFFPIVVNTYDGLKNVDQEYINLLKTMGANKSQIFWKVRVPHALPCFFTGLRVGAAVSVIGAVIGEWLGGNAGLGTFSRRMLNNLQTETGFTAVLILALLGMGLFALVKAIETIALPWFNKSNEVRSKDK
ncbi:MAG: ABC transporter permease [Peptococcaceae bacterium]